MDNTAQQTNRPLIKALFHLIKELLKQDNHGQKLAVLKIKTREIENTVKAALEVLNNNESKPTRNNIQLAKELLYAARNQLAECGKDGE